MMRVLYVIDSLGVGGAESSLVSLAPHIRSKGIDLEVCYLKERDGLRDELQKAGIKVFSVGVGLSPYKWLHSGLSLVRSRRVDLLHTVLFDANLVGRITGMIAGIPVVSSLVGVPFGNEQLLDKNLVKTKVRVAQALEALTARKVVRFHAVSKYVADQMAKRLYLRHKPIDVIHRGRDPEVLGTRAIERRSASRRALQLSSEHRIVLAVARHEYVKGLDILIGLFREVLGSVPNAILLIAGPEGSQTSRLQADVDAWGLREHVRFLGYRSDVADLMCAADVLTLTSRREGFPGVLLEALALELPIVAVDIPAVREILVPPMDACVVAPEARSMSRSIQDCLLNPNPWKERATHGRRLFLERFTVERSAEEMVKFYDRALSQRMQARKDG